MFSESEIKILEILDGRKMTIAELTKEFYSEPLPMDANNKVASVVRRIVRKCEHHDLTWTLAGEGAGRAGRTVWKKRRKRVGV